MNDIDHGHEVKTKRGGWWGDCLHGTDLDAVCRDCNKEFDFERSAVLLDPYCKTIPCMKCGRIISFMERTGLCFACNPQRGFPVDEHLCVHGKSRASVCMACEAEHETH